MTEKKEAKVNETRQAAASYIVTFYNEIMILLHDYSQYLNILLELEQKYPDKISIVEKLSTEEKIVLVQSVQAIRYNATKAHIQFKTINETAIKDNKPSSEELLEEETGYKKVRDTFLINREELENYVFIMNKFLAKKVMQELLETSQQFINDIYGEGGAAE